MSLVKVLILIGAFFQIVQSYGTCTDEDEAAQCKNAYKCCNKKQYCGTNADSCYPENGGIPERDHCYYLLSNGTCKNCCFMTQQKHYCGTQQQCSDASSANIISTVIIVLYCVFIASCCIGGVFRHFQTKRLMFQILQRSVLFDQEKVNYNNNYNNNGMGINNGVINVMI